MKIFGREPTLWIQGISAVLSLLVTFQLDFLSAEQAALWVAAITALFTTINAFMVRPIVPSVFAGVIIAVAPLIAAYGVDVSQETVGKVVGVAAAIMMFLLRGQVSPAQDATETGVLGNKVTTGGVRSEQLR